MRAALEEAEQVLPQTYRVLAEAARRDEDILSAGKRILDNRCILQEQADRLKEHFARSYFEKLPCLAFGPRRSWEKRRRSIRTRRPPRRVMPGSIGFDMAIALNGSS
jgi:hypothetical protein